MSEKVLTGVVLNCNRAHIAQLLGLIRKNARLHQRLCIVRLALHNTVVLTHSSQNITYKYTYLKAVSSHLLSESLTSCLQNNSSVALSRQILSISYKIGWNLSSWEIYKICNRLSRLNQTLVNRLSKNFYHQPVPKTSKKIQWRKYI